MLYVNVYIRCIYITLDIYTNGTQYYVYMIAKLRRESACYLHILCIRVLFIRARHLFERHIAET